MGETIMGRSFALGPGGKGSNQAVAVARVGGDVTFISRLGQDAFGDLAMKTWADAGVKTAITRDTDSYTGAAYIFIEDATGDNAIIICPGAAGNISVADIEAQRDLIAGSSVFITQLEQPIEAARRALQIAKKAGVTTILNPAPAAALDDDIFTLCDYMTPNETETSELTGLIVETVDQARAAGDALRAKGVGTAVITLGENGALIHGEGFSEHICALNAGPVVETTGAGDAFNGGFVVGLAEGRDPVAAAKFGCAVAAISVTRAGTAPSMPARGEVEELLAVQGPRH
jgi:ribokinase